MALPLTGGAASKPKRDTRKGDTPCVETTAVVDTLLAQMLKQKICNNHVTGFRVETTGVGDTHEAQPAS